MYWSSSGNSWGAWIQTRTTQRRRSDNKRTEILVSIHWKALVEYTFTGCIPEPSVVPYLGVGLKPRADDNIGSNDPGVDQEGSPTESMQEGVQPVVEA